MLRPVELLDESGLASVIQVDTLTFPAKAGVTTGDYINVYAQDGTAYALFLDLTGADSNPTGANFVAADYSGSADISLATDAASVAAIAELALNALTDFTAKITTNDVAADGTMALTQIVLGPVTNPIPNNEDDTGAGSISNSPTTAGYIQPNVSSEPQDKRGFKNYTMAVQWTSSTCVGNIKAQESNDKILWIDAPSAGVQAILNNNGSAMLNLSDRGSAWVRGQIEYTSGTLTTAKIVFNAI